MKRILLGTVLTLLGLYSIASSADQHTESLDQIIAVVNDDVVTRSELNHSLDIIKMQLAQENVPMPSARALNKQALDQLINKKLQLQIAKQAGVTITDADLNRSIAYIAKQNNMSVSDLYSRISHDGMSAVEYKDEMREQITLQKLQQQEIVGHLSVTPEEISAFMRSNGGQTSSANEYRVQDILIPLPDAPSASHIAAAKQQAQTVLAALRQNQHASIAKDHVQSTDLGWRKLDEMPSLFTQSLASMQAHDISEPIEAPNGIHILRLTDVRAIDASSQAGPTRQQAENILLQRKFAEAVQTWVSKQRSQAFIKINAIV